MQLVFLAGLTHSGSTVVDLLLGGHSALIGLGEAASLVCHQSEKLREPERICSCGARIDECEFWSVVTRRLEQQPDLRPAGRYRLLLEVFREVFGPDRVPVDSSKSLGALRLAASLPEVDLRVLHLLRDVRAWTISRVDLDRRHWRMGLDKVRAENGGRLWLYYLQQLSVARFAIWYRGNRRIQRFISEARLRSLELSYERLALDGAGSVREICSFLDVDDEPLLEQLGTSRSHVALGNPMRLDANRRSAVVYDYRWLARREWVLASLLLPHVMAYNCKHVYRAAAAPPATMAARAVLSGATNSSRQGTGWV